MNVSKSAIRILFMLLAVVSIASTLLASACGPAPATPTPTQAPTASPAPSTQAPATQAPAVSATPATGQPKYGGTLQFWTAGYPAGFDPHRRPYLGPLACSPVFSNLVRFDPAKVKCNMSTVIGDLAKSWSVSADGLAYTFVLEQGVKWSDGKPFTADDVMYNFDKMRDPARSTIYPNIANITEVTKLDDYSVRVKLNGPSPNFLILLAWEYFVIEPQHLASTDWHSTDFLVGTGPYMFKSATSGVSMNFVKNPNYFHKDPAGNKLPYLDGLTLTVISDRQAAANALLSKRVDITNPITGVANEEIYNQLKADKNIQFQSTVGGTGVGITFKMDKGPLADVRVRKAIALVLDPNDMNMAVYGGFTTVNPDVGLMPTTYGMPLADIKAILMRDKPYAERVTAAKQLMKDAGYADGFTIELLSTNAMAESGKLAIYIQDIVKRNLNITTNIDTPDYTTTLQRAALGNYGIYPWQPSSMLGEPNDLMPFFVTGNPLNTMSYSNPAIDALWKQQAVELNFDNRIKITRQIEKGILSDYAYVPDMFFMNVTAYQTYVKGFVAQESAYTVVETWERVWLDK
jgi:peptide/nickel transport system substrate-binding protein